MVFRVVLLLLFISKLVFSQDFERTFGNVTKEELELQSYKNDRNAEALILFDIGHTLFFDANGGYDIRFTRTKRIKIFENAGIKFAEVSIPYYEEGYGRTENVSSIEAYTYNLDNDQIVISALDQSTVYEEKIDAHWSLKKFVFPNVKAGSVVEYRYILESPFHFNLPDWTFQDMIPTLYSQYTVNMIPFYEYVFYAQAITSFDHQASIQANETRTWGSVGKSYGQNVGGGIEFRDYIHTYVMEDVPAFKDEAYITSPNDYLMRMDFQLSKFHSPSGKTTEIMTTWPRLVEEFLENDDFGKFMKKSSSLAKKLLKNNIEISGKEKTETCKNLINYVKSNFSWNGAFSTHAAKSPKAFMEQKSGNVAELNLFMTSLLNEANIEAYPVLISTRNHGKVRTDYPLSDKFNYVVTYIPGLQLLADATESILPYDRVPPRCLNDKGLIVKEGEAKWVELENTFISAHESEVVIQIDTENLVSQATVSIQSTEYEAFAYKEKYINDTQEIIASFEDLGLKNISNLKTENFTNYDKPYEIWFTCEGEVEAIGDNILIKPFLNLPLQENQLTQKERTYPVDFIYPRMHGFSSKIHIPEGYHILKLPESYEVHTELADIKIHYSTEGNTIQVSGRYTFFYSVYQPGEYARIKNYLNTIVEKFNDEIVLQRN